MKHTLNKNKQVTFDSNGYVETIVVHSIFGVQDVYNFDKGTLVSHANHNNDGTYIVTKFYQDGILRTERYDTDTSSKVIKYAGKLDENGNNPIIQCAYFDRDGKLISLELNYLENGSRQSITI